MKSILIIGASNAGKSTTIREVCKRLNPEKVYRLYPDKENVGNSKIKISEVENIYNDTFIIEFQGKMILVIAGAPTEQNVTITVLIDICIEIKIDISFVLATMRSFEKRKGFDTKKELEMKSKIILTEKIYRINDESYIETSEWNNRVNKIVETVKANI